MWVCLNDAFVSIVEDASDPRRLLCRARFAGDLQRAFAGRLRGRRVKHTPHADYAYRVSLPRETVALALTERLYGLHYRNFKNSVGDNDLHRVYMRVWAVVKAEQDRREGVAGPDLFGDRAPDPQADEPSDGFADRIVVCPRHGEVSAAFCVAAGCPHAGTREWRDGLLPPLSAGLEDDADALAG